MSVTCHRQDCAHQAAPRALPAPIASLPSTACPLYLAALALLAATALAVLVDVQAARFFSNPDRLPGDVRKMINMAEVFGFGGGAAMICLAVWVLDPGRRSKMPRLLTCAFGSGLGAICIKGMIGRLRPYAFDFEGGVWETFGPVVPSLHGVETAAQGAVAQAFPSGHTAVAVGLAIGLGWMYPQGRKLFAIFALMAAFQRLTSSAHYVSDILAGAGVAFLICGTCFDGRFSGRLFALIEDRGSERSRKSHENSSYLNSRW